MTYDDDLAKLWPNLVLIHVTEPFPPETPTEEEPDDLA